MECMRASFQKGQLLDGRFRTLAPLNHGSFGMVFLAEDVTTKQEVAIKCLTKSCATSDFPITADDGAEELMCHAILRFHPHLVNLVHHFETDAHNYLVLEYCSQGDLYEAIRLGKGPLQTDHVRRFMLQLISAVEHMHNNGLYHRDIKPENIFITASGDMKLGDFGLATRSLWSTEACVGSDRYMAPEQYDHGGNGYCPAKADLWSLGICLLNILFARNPFVTPTESDVLFADYRRDRQSLFDIFPSMSQDTYEILSIAMALDPAKRDLHALRFAVQRATAFTADDDSLDEYCLEERDVVRASANREPLRTPSVQSPQMDGDAFPWAQVLKSSPHPKQSHLPSIPDEYDEDLFPASEKGLNLGESWFSARFNTPSMASVMGSTFGSSIHSTAVRHQSVQESRRAEAVTFPKSLPTRPSRPMAMTVSQVFGKKDTVAKSWSEMWEEDEEETEREEAAAVQARRELNARSFSHDSAKKEELVEEPVHGVPSGSKKPSVIDVLPSAADASKPNSPTNSSTDSFENDMSSSKPRSPKRSPRQVPADKWAALGNRRRNPQVEPEALPLSTKKRSMTTGSRRRTGSSSQENQPWQRRESRTKGRPAYLNQDWRQHRVIDSSEEDDHEWVGGWHNFHL